MIIQVKVEKLEFLNSNVQFMVEVELKYIAFFKTISDKQKDAKDAVFKSLVDYLLKVSKWKTKTESINSKLATIQVNDTNGKSCDNLDKRKSSPENATKMAFKSNSQLSKTEKTQTVPEPNKPMVEMVEMTLQANPLSQSNNVDKVKKVYFAPIDNIFSLINQFVKGKFLYFIVFFVLNINFLK